MIHFTVDRDPKLLSDEDIYAIRPVLALEELLRAAESLCLVCQPEWGKRSVALRQLRGTLEGKAAVLYFERNCVQIQSATKNALDRNLISPYLFISWKKDGHRTFKLVCQGKTLKEFDTFAPAIDALIPANFKPQAEYHRKLTVMEILCLQAKRAQERQMLFRRLIELLKIRSI